MNILQLKEDLIFVDKTGKVLLFYEENIRIFVVNKYYSLK